MTILEAEGASEEDSGECGARDQGEGEGQRRDGGGGGAARGQDGRVAAQGPPPGVQERPTGKRSNRLAVLFPGCSSVSSFLKQQKYKVIVNILRLV